MKSRIASVLLPGFLFLIFNSCNDHSFEKKPIIDFYRWPENENGKFREYTCITDSSMLQLFLKQKSIQINDTLWQHEFEWQNHLSKPIFRGKERISTGGYFEQMEYYRFEKISSDDVIPIEAEFLSKKTGRIGDSVIRINVRFRFSSDTARKIITYAEGKCRIGPIDTLGIKCSNCLMVYTSEYTTLQMPNGESKKLTEKNVKLHKLNKGLIAIIHNIGDRTRIFKLNE